MRLELLGNDDGAGAGPQPMARARAALVDHHMPGVCSVHRMSPKLYVIRENFTRPWSSILIVYEWSTSRIVGIVV
jgi:hypothetical protein